MFLSLSVVFSGKPYKMFFCLFGKGLQYALWLNVLQQV